MVDKAPHSLLVNGNDSVRVSSYLLPGVRSIPSNGHHQFRPVSHTDGMGLGLRTMVNNLGFSPMTFALESLLG